MSEKTQAAEPLPDRVDEFGEPKPLDAPYDGGNRTDVAAKKKAAKLKDRGRDRILDMQLQSKDGRAFLYDLIYRQCGIDAAALNTVSTEFSMFREGQRAIGILLKNATLKANRDAFLLMLVENMETS